MDRRFYALLSAFSLALILSSCTSAASGTAGGVDTSAAPTGAENTPVDGTPAQEETTEPAPAPEWFGTVLTDVNTGADFTINDFRGKVILVETMAMWCSNCLKQQQQVKALHGLLGAEEGWVGIALDIDPNEDAGALKAYASGKGFDWIYAIAPPEVYREIGRLYGDQFLNPPSTPILLIDRDGAVHPLPFGIKSAESLLDAIRPYLEG